MTNHIAMKHDHSIIHSSDPILKEDLVECSQKLSIIQEESNFIIDVTQKSVEKEEKYTNFFENSKILNALIKYFAIECDEWNDKVNQLSIKYKSHCYGYRKLFGHVRELTIFYQKSLQAYDHLIKVEIPRRIEIHKQFQDKIDDFETKIHTMRKQETAKRKEFELIYSQYLPKGIAPGLQEDVPNIKAVPNKLKTELPMDTIQVGPTSLSQSLEYSNDQNGSSEESM